MTTSSKKTWTITFYLLLSVLAIEAIAFEHSDFEPKTLNLNLDESMSGRSIEVRRLESSPQPESPESTHKAKAGHLKHSEVGDRPHTQNLLAVEEQIREDDNEKSYVSAYWLFGMFCGLLALVIIGVGCMFCRTGNEADDRLNELSYMKKQNLKEDSPIIIIDDEEEQKEKESVLNSEFFRPTHLFKAKVEKPKAEELTVSTIIPKKEEDVTKIKTQGVANVEKVAIEVEVE